MYSSDNYDFLMVEINHASYSGQSVKTIYEPNPDMAHWVVELQNGEQIIATGDVTIHMILKKKVSPNSTLLTEEEEPLIILDDPADKC